jgi:hypothetical protein
MADRSPHRNLVLSTVGDNSRHPTWLTGNEPRNFDLFLIYFGENPDYNFSGAAHTLRRKGFKYPLIDHALTEFASIFAQYDRIWLPDDDIAADTATVNRIFDLFAQNHLQLAQPAISAGEVSYESLRQTPRTILRYTPYVEVMCPIFTREALYKVKPLFLETQSGWGIDWVWSKWFAKGEVAILDACGVEHTGKLLRGELYQKLKARGIDPYQEFDDCVARHGGINRRHHKRMLRGRMAMSRIPAPGQALTLWEKATRHWRWAA